MKTESSIYLEKVSSFASRRRMENLLFIPLCVGALSLINILPVPSHPAAGIFLLSLSLIILVKLLDLYFVSLALEPNAQTFLTRFMLSGDDIWNTFFKHSIRNTIIMRLGMDHDEVKKLVLASKVNLTPEIQSSKNLGELMGNIFDTSSEIKSFFESRGVTRKSLVFGADWAERDYIESLNKVVPFEGVPKGKNLGQSLAFGEAFLLERFSLNFKTLGITFTTEDHEEELKNIISILNKTREANAVLVGDDKLSSLSILYTLEKRIGETVSIFDGASFISDYGEKASFESNFSRLLEEASHAGNAIVVIQDLPEFIDNAKTFGSDVISLMDPYIAVSNIQVIATASVGSYEKHFEHALALLARFEKVQVRPESNESILRFAMSRVQSMEKEQKVLFTSGAVLAIRDSVVRFTPDLMIDATDDLIEETVSTAKANKQKVIKEEDVLARIEAKTGIPVSGASSKEKSILSNLEDLLGARVIGQKEAISAVSAALRRARAGISNENRPMGSFLFLGPTGVGKTETTKALSDIFFGSNAPLVRFDMSEYNSSNALTRLIGTLESSGTLSTSLREHEYGVLLLDEFEKTDKAVIDLFLQILDEGFFSDGQGKKVNVRNHIIIMTSNAASDKIFDLVKNGKDLSVEKDSIIEALIERALFKPELLNRFDGIVLFHPLTTESLQKIASLMLASLNKRLSAKGLSLTVNEDLINFLLSKGQDPKFGARPLNRAIQDSIESLIAKRILDGTYKIGDTITLRSEDLV